MEIINIEARTYEAMIKRFDSFTRKVESLCEQHRDVGLKTWLDNQDVCLMLGITKRTLQTYRERGLIPFSRIRHKVFYRPEDVEKLLQSSSHPSILRKP
ncbi:helix-turn-helix domain-containing protein [Limibacterium fermenti]|uniref:helix-turn-helix domain-containing protein n=1 Tax=Limibacterium fermenti TaxID=3229863 RepID=UPI000E852ED5|nr:DNA-binding protein [Porphyromonadaceae bacterium]